ncbi:MAG TPA: retropepsin-like aspartic protease [Thermoanaerobaculia bacterium]|nr:retropepsin-like aspartic protease [Thermoanaerobaculia bacterium]HUM29945.1 retropepsin-like aspartic protease [Thermoanaerobaculia bacterium]HXK68188.1 retropepsin-like aspartic protease [Thermoanaerobaculia bacterium]
MIPALHRLVLFGFLVILGGCSYEFDMEITKARPTETRHAPLLNTNNYPKAIEDGYYLDVERYLDRNSDLVEEHAKAELALGQILLYRGKIEEAAEHLLRARDRAGSLEVKSRSNWFLTLCYYYLNRFAISAFYAEEARHTGVQIDEGFIAFLKKGANRNLYRMDGTEAKVSMTYNQPRLPFLSVVVNGSEARAVVDTGASMTIISSSLAEELGIQIDPEMKSWGYGLHQKKIDLHFAYLDTLRLGEITVYEVPVMVFPDEDLIFQTRRGTLKIDVALGYHLLRQGRLFLDYRAKILQWVPASTMEPLEDQNLFVTGLRPSAMVAINEAFGYHFILDTGSEKTFLSTSGSNRSSTQEKINFYKMIFHGFGKARTVNLKAGDLLMALAGYQAAFKDIPVNRESSSLIDGYVGNDFLSNFQVMLDFPHGRISLTPYRLARAEIVAEPEKEPTQTQP